MQCEAWEANWAVTASHWDGHDGPASGDGGGAAALALLGACATLIASVAGVSIIRHWSWAVGVLTASSVPTFAKFAASSASDTSVQ